MSIRRNRQKPPPAAGTSLIGGLHAIRSLLVLDPADLVELWIESGRRDERVARILELTGETGARIWRVERRVLDELIPGTVHQGLVARVRTPVARDEHFLRRLLDGLDVQPLLLVLDGVKDPHNLGACLRTADAAAAHAVIVPKDRATGLTATVIKVASGAAQTVPLIQVTNLNRTLSWLQGDYGIWLVGTAAEAETPLFEADLTGPLALILGGEEKGLRRLTRERCDLLVSLPMHGHVESLNVSVTTGICLYEAVRQRSPAKSTG